MNDEKVGFAGIAEISALIARDQRSATGSSKVIS
jgi:hypothetical protein